MRGGGLNAECTSKEPDLQSSDAKGRTSRKNNNNYADALDRDCGPLGLRLFPRKRLGPVLLDEITCLGREALRGVSGGAAYDTG